MNGYLGNQTSGNHWPAPTSANAYHEFQEFNTLPGPRQGDAILADFEQQMFRFDHEHDAKTAEIRKHYVLPSSSSVLAFLVDHRTISDLLLEAVPSIRKHFGSDAVFHLRVPADESGSRTLYAVAVWSGEALDVRNALERFDDTWWIAHSRQASGYLVFTYELV